MPRPRVLRAGLGLGLFGRSPNPSKPVTDQGQASSSAPNHYFPLHLFLLALFAVSADFGSRNCDLHLEVPRNLLLELLVKAAFKFPHLAATEARYVNVVPRAVALVVVPVTAQVQQVELVDKPLFFEKIDGAVDSYQMHVGFDFPSAFQNLVYIQMLLGSVHHLEDDAPLPRESNPALANGLL